MSENMSEEQGDTTTHALHRADLDAAVLNEPLNNQVETRATAKDTVLDEQQDAPEEPRLLLSDSAANKVRELIVEENNENLKLRVFITGGGCSGFQYGFTFDESVNEDDFTLEKNGVMLLVDAMSFQYLEDAEIDYKEDLEGSRFVIRNPQATTTCGCGSSFAVD